MMHFFVMTRITNFVKTRVFKAGWASLVYAAGLIFGKELFSIKKP